MPDLDSGCCLGCCAATLWAFSSTKCPTVENDVAPSTRRPPGCPGLGGGLLPDSPPRPCQEVPSLSRASTPYRKKNQLPRRLHRELARPTLGRPQSSLVDRGTTKRISADLTVRWPEPLMLIQTTRLSGDGRRVGPLGPIRWSAEERELVRLKVGASPAADPRTVDPGV